MTITLIAIGRTDNEQLNSLIQIYLNRLKHYINFNFIIIPDIKRKNLNEALQKKLEGEQILKNLSPGDEVVLLDEKGKGYTSEKFADFLQKNMNRSVRNLVFVIGGPYGFSDEIYEKANGKISLSSMTFSHQMVRLFFVEQVYRAFTILRNEPYHHR